MPQELHVIRCFACQTFQVHIVKKTNKWACKMCGEKQSIKKVYFQGSGKDCRLNVQKLNEARILNENKLKEDIEQEEFEIQSLNENAPHDDGQPSKWEQFLPKDMESSEDEISDNSKFTFDRPSKKKSKLTIKRNEFKQNSEELPDNEDHSMNQNNIQDDNLNKSKWKSFMSNIKNNSGTVVDNPMNTTNKSDSLINDQKSNSNSKWNCFLDNKNENDSEHNVSLNLESNQIKYNIFNSDDDNLDDILKL